MPHPSLAGDVDAAGPAGTGGGGVGHLVRVAEVVRFDVCWDLHWVAAESVAGSSVIPPPCNLQRQCCAAAALARQRASLVLRVGVAAGTPRPQLRPLPKVTMHMEVW